VSDPVAIRDPTRFAGPPAHFVATNTRSTLIDRTRLDDRFKAATGGVIRLLGPGGYGKSTLVARWAAHDERAVRWLDLEAIDNDSLVLGHALRQAVASLRTAPLNSTADPDIARMVASCTEPFILVLDDVHHLESGASAALLSQVIAGLPPTSTLVLVGRAHHHAKAITRFRLEPGVIDVVTADLAFDLAETEQLLAAMGVEPDIDALSELADQFEGWPAGLRLAGMVMSRRESGFEVPVNRLGSVEYVTDYITEEWFGGLKTADQYLLMELGCLGRFSGDSCEEILGIADAAPTLRRLCREEVVLLALDQLGDWYRLHPLLQRWLCSRLRSQNRSRWSAIAEATARWWEREGDIDLAIEHAMAGEHLDVCEELITTHAGLYSARGMYLTVQRWLTNLGDARIRSSPRLRVVASTVAVYAGEGEAALHWARLAWDEVNSTEAGAAPTDNLTMLQAEALRAGLVECREVV
jgi:LuxR family maltose regulon positive regulatory protein